MSCQIKGGKYFAPNGAESRLYSELEDKVGKKQAHELFVLAYTPSFTRDIVNPIINSYKSRLPELPSNLTVKDTSKGKSRTIELSEDGEVKGRIILAKYKDGYKIKSSFVEEVERGKGLGRALYTKTASTLIAEGLNLYSDQIRTESADKMWDYLSSLNLTKDRRTVFAKPQTLFNSDGEIVADKVLAYATKVNERTEPLTSVEQQEVRMMMSEFPNIKSSEELIIKMDKAFYNNGVFSPSKRSLSELYSTYEAENLLGDIVMLGTTKEAIEKLKRTETVYNNSLIEATYKSTDFNIFGKLKNQNPYVIQQDIIEEFGGIESPDLSEVKDRTITEAYLAEFSRLPAINVGGDPIIEEVVYSNAVKVVDNVQLLESVDAIIEAPSSVDTVSLEKKVAEGLLNYGIKIEGFSKEFLPALRDFIVDPSVVNTQAFSEAYREEFNLSVKQREYVLKVNSQGRDLVYLETNQTEQQLFDTASLLKTANENVYHRIEKVDFEEMRKALDLSETITELQAYKDYFGYTEKTVNEVKTFTPTVLENSLEYLTNEFIADLNVEILKNPENGLYNKFKITEKGIEMKYNDPISVAEVRAHIKDGTKLSQALKEYSLIARHMDSLEDEQEVPLNNKYNNRIQAVNNFNSVSKPKGVYTKINREITTVKNSTEEFLNIENELYELVDKQGNMSVYNKIQKNTNLLYSDLTPLEPGGLKIENKVSTQSAPTYSEVRKQWKDAEIGDMFSC